jgi:RNA polymerase sigma-70 factor (ECF subfamily)
MDATRKSLLLRAQAGDDQAWKDLTKLYRPHLVGWLRSLEVSPNDIDDLVQDILFDVVRSLPSFSHSGRVGAFRTWLRTIAHAHTCDYWKSRSRQPRVRKDLDVAKVLRDLEDPASDVNRWWDEEHDRYVLRCLLQLIELQFETSTVLAFRRVALEGASTTDAARELGLSVGAVYAAKSRVLRRLREEGEGLMEAFP